MRIAQAEFTNYNALAGPYARTFRRDKPFPFPDERGNNLNMGYIAFGPTGELLRDPNVLGDPDEIIVLARGTVFPTVSNGTYLPLPAIVTEIPPGNSVDTNSYNRIRINWLTGRSRVERKELP